MGTRAKARPRTTRPETAILAKKLVSSQSQHLSKKAGVKFRLTRRPSHDFCRIPEGFVIDLRTAELSWKLEELKHTVAT